MLAYASVAILSIAATLALLSITKIPAVVMLIAPSIATAAVMVYARLDLGYWDPFAPIAAAFCWGLAFVVSFALLGLGRSLKWAFFLSKKSDEMADSGAL